MRRTVIALALSATLVVGAACSSDGPSSQGTVAPSMTQAPDATVGGTAPLGFDGAPEGTESFGPFDRTHVDTPVDYPQDPPVGGPHNPVWQTCQFYAVPIVTELGVHSMEHGAVWVTFQPDLPADQVATLEALAAGGIELLVSPYPGLTSPVVASAWGVQLRLDAADDPRLAQFVAFFQNGPQTPELDTPCAQGTTETP
jgi:hypothetical protein